MSNSVTMVTDSSLTVTLQAQYTIASIYCVVVELEPEDHFIVREGDYVGVELPMSNPILLVGVSSDYTLWSSPHSGIDMSLLLDSLIQTILELFTFMLLLVWKLFLLMLFKLITVCINYTLVAKKLYSKACISSFVFSIACLNNMHDIKSLKIKLKTP